MDFNLVGSLLAVSSEKGTLHVLRLRSGQQGGDGRRSGLKAVGACASLSLSPTAGGSGNGRRCDDASSPPESVDGSTQGLDGGYVVFIEKKKSAVFRAFSFLLSFFLSFLLLSMHAY